jgi:hypothetical protein
MFAKDFPPDTEFWEVNDSRCKSRAVAGLPEGTFIDAVTGEPVPDMVFGEYVERLGSAREFDELVNELTPKPPTSQNSVVPWQEQVRRVMANKSAEDMKAAGDRAHAEAAAEYGHILKNRDEHSPGTTTSTQAIRGNQKLTELADPDCLLRHGFIKCEEDNGLLYYRRRIYCWYSTTCLEVRVQFEPCDYDDSYDGEHQHKLRGCFIYIIDPQVKVKLDWKDEKERPKPAFIDLVPLKVETIQELRSFVRCL